METLQALVTRRAAELGGREGARNPRQLEEAAAKAGYKVSRETFRRMANGTYSGRTDHATVLGLVAALEVSIEVVEQAVGAPKSYGTFDLTPDANRLTPVQRKAVMAVVQAMLKPDGVAAAEPPKGYARAARKGTTAKARGEDEQAL